MHGRAPLTWRASWSLLVPWATLLGRKALHRAPARARVTHVGRARYGQICGAIATRHPAGAVAYGAHTAFCCAAIFWWDRSNANPTQAHIWLNDDRFALLTRPALTALASWWDELRHDTCESLPPCGIRCNGRQPGFTVLGCPVSSPCCGARNWTIECVLLRHLGRFSNLSVHWNNSLNTRMVRPHVRR